MPEGHIRVRAVFDDELVAHFLQHVWGSDFEEFGGLRAVVLLEVFQDFLKLLESEPRFLLGLMANVMHDEEEEVEAPFASYETTKRRSVGHPKLREKRVVK